MLLVTDVVLRIVKSRLQFFMKLLNWILGRLECVSPWFSMFEPPDNQH